MTESADFDAPPAEVWKRIGRFGDLGWHPVVASTEITKGTDNKRGAVRSIKTKDGAEIVEELLSRSEGKHQLRYRILTSPVAGGGLRVGAEGGTPARLPRGLVQPLQPLGPGAQGRRDR